MHPPETPLDAPIGTATAGDITFLESCRPPLPDGDYRITVTQTARNTATSLLEASFDEAFQNVRRFIVRGERFSIASAEIGTLFPPPASTGEYAHVLPHVVFERATLPWERTAGDDLRSSWLALLLFDADDPVPETLTIQVGDLTPTPFPHAKDASPTASGLPVDTVSYPSLDLDYGEFAWARCSAIDVPVRLFQSIAPGVVDLPWLSHARTITTGKAERLGLNAAEVTTIETSVVMCNRLPRPDARCTVHLVSLEGMAPFLASGSDYALPPITLPNGEPARKVRLISMANWTYQSLDPKQNFTALLKGLDADDDLRVLAVSDNADQSGTPAAYAHQAMAMGFVPLEHQTRQGSRTISWYRGPFLPYAAAGEAVSPPPEATGTIGCSDQLLRYDPGTGMMDVSYSAAWEVGRLLALQDPEFAKALYDFKKRNSQAVADSLQAGILSATLGEAIGVDIANDTLAGSKAQHVVADFIVQRLGTHLVGGEPL